MRVSLRLLAEGSGRGPDLSRYLQEPLLLFLPLRTLLGLVEGFSVLLLARMIGVTGPMSLLLLTVSIIAFGAVCEFLIPFLIVSKDPERILDLLLPGFRMIGRPLEPLTRGLLHLLGRQRRDRLAPVSVNRDEVNDDGQLINAMASDAGSPSAGNQDEQKLLKSIDFGDTLREVMTPRPDIVAIRADDAQRLRASSGTGVFPHSGLPHNLDNIVGFVYRISYCLVTG
jgi:CBS domain containing-hemolysin-like protein